MERSVIVKKRFGFSTLKNLRILSTPEKASLVFEVPSLYG
jgi:hypothetical protein